MDRNYDCFDVTIYETIEEEDGVVDVSVYSFSEHDELHLKHHGFGEDSTVLCHRHGRIVMIVM